jgi:glycosyl-4,4'-diaponeurosporenoate acyltransferase
MKSIYFYLILNTIFWITVNFFCGYIVHFIPDNFYTTKNFIFKKRNFEKNGLLYKKLLFIQKWKDKLPDGGKVLGLHPFSKKHFEYKKKDYIEKFILETCRGELTHILPFIFLPISFTWNPLIGSIIMTLYCFFSNFPCIIVQRYNRIRLIKLLKQFFEN